MQKVKKEDLDPKFFRGIAHRGLHGPLISENSLPAFGKAIEEGFAFELDVHLTKDDKLVVIHDGDLYRMTGVDGVVEDCLYEDIEKLRLPNGETIPTLQEVLLLNFALKVPMVIELKTGKRYKKLASLVYEALIERSIPYSEAMIISFDPRVLWAFGKGRFPRSFLVTKDRPGFMRLINRFESLDLETSLLDDPRVLKYREKGGLVNSWTYRDEALLKEKIGLTDMYTFEGFDPRKVI